MRLSGHERLLIRFRSTVTALRGRYCLCWLGSVDAAAVMVERFLEALGVVGWVLETCQSAKSVLLDGLQGLI